MKTAIDCPFTRNEDGRWDLLVTADREVEWGHAFDAARGYRVMLAFKDSAGKNTLSAESTRRLADELLDPREPDQAYLAAELRKMAEQVEGLNRGWDAAGRPASGLEDLQGGRA